MYGTMIATLTIQEVKRLLGTPDMASLELKIPFKYLSTVSNQDTAVANFSTAYLDLADSDYTEAPTFGLRDGHFRSVHSHKLIPERPNASFKLFPKLPLEIRRQIWDIAITDILPRCVRVVEKPYFDGTSDLVLYGAPCPPLLTTCKEVYDEVLTTKTYLPMFQMIGYSKSVYFNPRLDIVEFCVEQTGVGAGLLPQLHPQLVFSQRLINPNDATEGIQNIRIGGDLMQFAEKWVAKNIDKLENLKTFALGGTFPFHRSISLPLQPMHFFFETIADGLSGDSFVTPFFFDEHGEYFRDLDAMQRITYDIQDIRERLRPWNIWYTMNRVVKETKKLPKVYEVQFHYTHEY